MANPGRRDGYELPPEIRRRLRGLGPVYDSKRSSRRKMMSILDADFEYQANIIKGNAFDEQKDFIDYILQTYKVISGENFSEFVKRCIKNEKAVDSYINEKIENYKSDIEKFKNDILSYEVGNGGKISLDGIALLQMIDDSDIKVNFTEEELNSIAKKFGIEFNNTDNILIKIHGEKNNFVNRFVAKISELTEGRIK